MRGSSRRQVDKSHSNLVRHTSNTTGPCMIQHECRQTLNTFGRSANISRPRGAGFSTRLHQEGTAIELHGRTAVRRVDGYSTCFSTSGLSSWGCQSPWSWRHGSHRSAMRCLSSKYLSAVDGWRRQSDCSPYTRSEPVDSDWLCVFGGADSFHLCRTKSSNKS